MLCGAGRRIDEPFALHLDSEGLEFLQFTFRWSAAPVLALPAHFLSVPARQRSAVPLLPLWACQASTALLLMSTAL